MPWRSMANDGFGDRLIAPERPGLGRKQRCQAVQQPMAARRPDCSRLRRAKLIPKAAVRSEDAPIPGSGSRLDQEVSAVLLE